MEWIVRTQKEEDNRPLNFPVIAWGQQVKYTLEEQQNLEYSNNGTFYKCKDFITS